MELYRIAGRRIASECNAMSGGVLIQIVKYRPGYPGNFWEKLPDIKLSKMTLCKGKWRNVLRSVALY